MRTRGNNRKNSGRDIRSSAGSIVAPEAALYLTREQMAVRYQACPRTIDYWVEDQTLPVYKRGRVVRFHPRECDEALKKFRRESRFEETNEQSDESDDNGDCKSGIQQPRE